MRGLRAIAFSALLNSAMAYKIPSGTPDGVYRVAVGKNGTTTQQKVADIVSVTLDWSFTTAIEGFIKDVTDFKHRKHRNHRKYGKHGKHSKHSKGRKSSGSHLSSQSVGPECNKEGAHVQLQQIHTAGHSLGRACTAGGDHYVPEEGHQFALAGDVVVYVCNYWRSTSRSCDANTLYDDLRLVERACPAGGAGESNSTIFLCRYPQSLTKWVQGWYADSETRETYGYDESTAHFCV